MADPWPTMAEVRRRHLAATLERAGGNKVEAARLLGVSPKTVYNWLAEFGRPTQEGQP